MSMRDYAVDDYGIILRKEEIDYIKEHLSKKYKDERDWDEFEIVENTEAEAISQFTGECFLMYENGKIDYSDSISFYDGSLLYFSVPKWSTLFKAPYSNMEELIEDMKNKYGDWLPEDYDYKHKIYKISGTYFG